MVSIADGIAAVTASIGLAKELRSLDKTIGDAEFKLKVADLTTSLADAKTSLVDAQEQISELKRKIVDADQRWEARSQTTVFQGFRYDLNDGTPEGMPYCTRCESVDHRMVRLSRAGTGRMFHCPQCKAAYEALKVFPYIKPPAET